MNGYLTIKFTNKKSITHNINKLSDIRRIIDIIDNKFSDKITELKFTRIDNQKIIQLGKQKNSLILIKK